jgi:hypothetical protein
LARQVIAGKKPLVPSSNDYDWLGGGIYFWEHNPQRAFDFAAEMSRRPHPSGQKILAPAVIGAVIDLGHCLNLLGSRSIELLRLTYDQLVRSSQTTGMPLPRNTGGADLVNRKLDCAVVETLHLNRADRGERPFDTVRAAFVEGAPLYENAGFRARTHIQICVRDPRRIKGYFVPLGEDGKAMSFA